jgi:hypothetical protein
MTGTHPLITAGQALAEFAREIADEARQASGDVMDGAHAEALAGAWEEAVERYGVEDYGWRSVEPETEAPWE